MVAKIIWTEAASGDVADIAHYIAKDSPYYAASFVREIRDAALSVHI